MAQCFRNGMVLPCLLVLRIQPNYKKIFENLPLARPQVINDACHKSQSRPLGYDHYLYIRTTINIDAIGQCCNQCIVRILGKTDIARPLRAKVIAKKMKRLISCRY